jgi:hypothetical protein
MRFSRAFIAGLLMSAALLGCGSGSASSPASSAAATPDSASGGQNATSGTAAAATAATTALSISNNGATLTLEVTYQGTPSFVRVYIDSDENPSTGYPVAGIGADYLIENGYLYKYSGTAGSWAWTQMTTVSLAESGGVATWSVPLTELGTLTGFNAVGNYNSVYSSIVSYSLVSASVASRNALQWPFSSSSIWNMPIGSGAQYVPAGLSFTSSPNSTEYWYDLPLSDHERIVLSASSPVTPVYINTAGWSGGNRCVQQGALFFSAPIPADYVVANSTDNNGAAILLADGVTIAQTEPFTRCSGYSYATSMQVPSSIAAWEYNIQTGDGRLGAHGGSGLSTLGGTIRLGELRPGTQTRHALKILVDSTTSLGLCTGNFAACFTWPAATADSYAADAGSGYGSASNNTNTAMKMGALLAIPASVNINNIGLQSVPGKMLAWTMQNYGAYIVDSTGGPGFDIAIEDGAAGSKDDEFQSDYGYPFDGRLGYITLTTSTGQPTPQAQWVNDVRLIIGYLQVVSNNSASNVGGGGTPLQALAPAF